MKKFLTCLAMVVTSILVAVALFIIVAIAWYVWELHPWIPAGQSFALGHWRFGDFEFQVWQRKNTSIAEPFADNLFVRQGKNQWQAFCFDIQDGYLPKMRLQQDGSQVIVYRDGERRGVYDMASQTFQRHETPLAPAYIRGEPPGDW